jgi:hypothetical protein
MNEQMCRPVSRDNFLKGNDKCFNILTESVLAIVFIPQKWLLEEKLSQDKKAEIVEQGWDYFIENFQTPCIYSRIGWSIYYILVTSKKERVIESFKQIFQKWKNYYSEDVLWRIAFTYLHNTNKSWHTAIKEIEWRGRKIIERDKYHKLFSIQIGSNSVETIGVD